MEPTQRAYWRDLKSRYLAYLISAGRAPHTRELRIRHVDRLLEALGGVAGNVDLGSVKPAALSSYLGAHPHWQPNTLAGQRASIAGVFKWAHDMGFIATNPAAHLATVRVPHGKPHPASDADVDQAQHADPRTALMAEIAARAGLRCMEIAKLHRDDIITEIVYSTDGEPEERHHIRVTGKGSKTRIVPIGADLADRLRARGGWIFEGRIDGHVSAAYVSKLVSRALPPGVTCHKLRHRFATRALRSSKNIRAVQELLGHESLATTQVYTGLTNDELWSTALAAG